MNKVNIPQYFSLEYPIDIPLANSSIFPTQDILFPPPPPPLINYWQKFPTQTNFLKQYTYADFFYADFFWKGAACLYCFVKWTSFWPSNQMFFDVIECFLVLFYRMNFMCFADHLNSLKPLILKPSPHPPPHSPFLTSPSPSLVKNFHPPNYSPFSKISSPLLWKGGGFELWLCYTRPVLVMLNVFEINL